MDRNFTIPDYQINKLRCDLCNGYLSVAPISSFRDKNACGRCNPGWERNVIYEELAKLAKFPCFYCGITFPWDMVQKHEVECKGNGLMCPVASINVYKKVQICEFHKECHRDIECPFDLCGIKFENKNLLNHFNKYHKEYVFNNFVEAHKILKQEKVWNFVPDTQVCLIISNNIPFFLFIHKDCDSNGNTGDILSYNYYFSVFTLCLQNCNIKYSVSLKSSSGIDSIYKNQQINIFNEQIHRLTFLRAEIYRLKSFDFMTTKVLNIRRIDNLNIHYSIKIVLKENLITKIDYTKNNDADISLLNLTNIEKHFECPICKEYMCSPIFNCRTGHSICKNCRKKLNTCPFCQAIIGNSRNFILEDILETIIISCQNNIKGCNFTGTITDIQIHENMCHYN